MELGKGLPQQVTLEGQSSTRADVISGVPQGTVMGPLLFLTFINDLPEYTKSDVRLFADDCLIYRKVNSLADARQLQQDLSSLEYWEKQWQMEFHPQKCTVIHVTRKQRPWSGPPWSMQSLFGILTTSPISSP